MRSNFEPSYGLSGTNRTTPPGTEARWYASCPADIDFSCGFQVNRSSGKRSRNFRVIGACASNSANMDSASDISVFLLCIVNLSCLAFRAVSSANSSGSFSATARKTIALRFVPSTLPGRRSPTAPRCLCSLSQVGVSVTPALPDSFSMLILNQSKRGVMKFDQRSTSHLAQSVLHIRDDRIRHKQGAGDLQ